MKKLNKKLQELITANNNGNLKNFIESLSAEKIGNYLHLIETKKREIIAESFNKIILIERAIEEAKLSLEGKKQMNGSNCFKLNWLKDDLLDLKNQRQAHLLYWEKIENLVKQKQKEHKLKRIKRIQENNI